MLKKILLLVLLSATFMFGSDWWIYTYEDVSTLKAVFNYLAMIKDDSGFLRTVETVLIAGLTFTIIFKFLDIAAIPKYLLSVVGTMLIVFSTTTTVHIVNVKSYNNLNPHIDNYAVVDNVPFIFAVLSSAFSSVGYNSALLIETIFSNVTSASDTTQASFLKTGNLGAWKILDALDSIDALAISSDGQDFNKNFNEYLQLCVFKIGYAIDPGLKSQVGQRSDVLEYLNPASSINPYVQTLSMQKVIDSEGSLTTCNSLYTKAYTSFSNLSASGVAYNKAQSLVSKITSNVDGAASTVAKMMTGSGLASAQANINNYILMTGVRKAFESSWQSYGIGASSAQAGFGAGLAEANLQAQGKVKAKSASSMMPSIHSVLQAVMYVLFPLVLIVQLFAGGFKILQNYILGILWLELWIPSYSVLNYFTLKEAQEQAYDKLVSSTASSGPEGMLTLANQNEIYNTIANQAAIAADFYIVGIPALAGFILFASFQALSGITSGVAGVVGQYSSNQTLNQERANLAALDSVNEQMKLNNPLYTGNVGTVQAMMAQSGSISQASKAAANFLASGSDLNNSSNMTKANMFSGLESMTKDMTRQQTLNNGGSLTNGLNVSANTSLKNTLEDRGLSNAMEKDSNMGNMFESNYEKGISYETLSKNEKFNDLGSKLGSVAVTAGGGEAQELLGKTAALKNLTDQQVQDASIQSTYENITSDAFKKQQIGSNDDYYVKASNIYREDVRLGVNTLIGKTDASREQTDTEQRNAAETSQVTSVADLNATKKYLEKNYGSLESGAESIANVNKGGEIEGIKKQTNVAGGEDKLIDVKSTQAAGKIAEEQSKQEILNKNGGYLNNMSDKGTFDGAQVKGKNQAMNTIGTEAIIQDSEVKTITSAGSSQGELNALESMKKAGLLDKDTSLYDKKVSDGGNFVAVDKDGNKITMYTDGKGNTLGYEKQTIDKDANDGKGAGVRSIHDANGKILAKVEDAARIKNYQDKEDRSKTTDFTMENKGAAYAGLNQKLSADLANAESEKDREKVLAKFFEDTRRVDSIANPIEMGKVIAKQAETGNMPDVRENAVDLNDRIDKFIEKNIIGGEKIVEFSKDVDEFAKAKFEAIKEIGDNLDKGAKEFAKKYIPGGDSLVDWHQNIKDYIKGEKETETEEHKNNPSDFKAPPAPKVIAKQAETGNMPDVRENAVDLN
ncbi:conjugal transfer protein TraG N-terminal domain-containing protein, partial [Aliarcobacter cryaerophilus]|uniref:conjugal transfer protein TraG N-terminal domain-containing protein n=1 Tax=Aliarcobacter cryaerophilus TaxID=28198 RepID=UPI0021B48584